MRRIVPPPRFCCVGVFCQEHEPNRMNTINQLPGDVRLALNLVRMGEKAYGPPRYLMIETVNLCNLRCRFCGQSEGAAHFTHGKGRMAFDLFKRLVDTLPRSWHSVPCVLTRDGEPLLNRDLEKFVAYYKQVTRTAPTICTNAMLLTRERAASLLDAGLHAFRSDFCADEAYYARWRQGGDWHTAYNNIRTYLRLAKEKRYKVKVIIGDIQADTFPLHAQKLAACEHTRTLFQEFPGMVHVFMNTLHTSLGNCEVVKTSEERGPDYTYCHHPWNELVIDFAGRAVGCFRDQRSDYVLGDVLEEGFEGVWNGERLRALRRAIAGREPGAIPICSHCDLPWFGSSAGTGGTVRKILNYVRKVMTAKARAIQGRPDGVYK